MRPRLAAWLEERTGLVGAWRSFAEQPVPGGASWFHALGATAAFLVALLFVTGVFLSFFYAPSAATAWASVTFIQDQLWMGWFVRGLHSFGSSALVVVTGLHFLQVLVWGAYRAPREVNWVVGLAMFLLVLVFAITGYGLPWDQKGYWAKLVETSIIGTTPLIGPALERIVQGGGAYGNYTVTHFFTVHVFLLPALMTALLILHLSLVRRHGVTPHWRLTDAEAAKRSQPYFPYQAVRDTGLSAVALAVVTAFVIARGGASLEGPADGAGGYMARPEWYAIPLYQLRMFFEGPLEIVATMIVPGLLGGALVALPFLDRSGSRSPGSRRPIMVAIAAAMVGTGVLSAMAVVKDARDVTFQKNRREVAAEAVRARALAARGVLPEGGLAIWKNDPNYEVLTLFRDKCSTCHTTTGAGGAEGPDLLDYNSRDWIQAFLLAPYSARFFGGANKPERGRMKPFDGPASELAAITEFVYAFSGAPDVDVALVQKGERIFSDNNCDSCHETDGTSEARGPNLKDRGTRGYVKRIIEDSHAPALYGDRAGMPKFQGKLSPGEIERLAEFVLSSKKP